MLTKPNYHYKSYSFAGVCKEVKEDYLDIISALSGSGPAYIYVMISALADGAVKCGLPRDLAQSLAANMIGGAAKMVTQSGKHPDQVTFNNKNISCFKLPIQWRSLL